MFLKQTENRLSLFLEIRFKSTKLYVYLVLNYWFKLKCIVIYGDWRTCGRDKNTNIEA